MSKAGGRQPAVLPAMVPPYEAVAAMCERVGVVGVELVPVTESVGRMLAQLVVADRDSPAADVSAMDGYAARLGDLESSGAATPCTLPVAFEVETGVIPPPLPAGGAARVFTGGVVPEGADVVVRREDVDESPEQITIRAMEKPYGLGRHIRRRGENARGGDVLLEPGARVGPAQALTMRTVGLTGVEVRRRVRVAVVVTGNEVVAQKSRADEPNGVAPGQVRDGNGPALRALVGAVPWCELVEVRHAGDQLDETREAIEAGSADADVVLTTGGVSMGDHDWVPAALRGLGAELVYHHLAMRPGKPNLGAVLPGGVAVFGLPGNPVSALVGAVVLAGPVLRRVAGYAAEPARVRCAVAQMESAPASPLSLWHYRLAGLDENGRAVPLGNHGSGDVPAAGRARGFFEVPPGAVAGTEARSWFDWEIA